MPENELSIQNDINLLQIENEKRELQFEERRLELLAEKDKRDMDYSLKHLDAFNDNNLKTQKNIVIMVITVSILLFAVIITCLCLDKEDFVTELIKMLFYGGFGSASGFFYGKSTNKDNI